jgi:hypothetical protein
MPDANNPKPNLDLIHMVQRARMLHDAEAIPSQVSAVYWIESKPHTPDVSPPTARAGQWVIPTTAAEADSLWAKVRAATESGQLGYKSKISTAPGPGQAQVNARLIYVRIGDSANAADVERVRAALVALGITPAHYMQDH